MAKDPEQYYLKPTSYVPNSVLPVLVYRDVLPPAPTPETIRAQIEPNDWLFGGVFKTYRSHHFHSVTHELYAVFRGSSKTLLGVGPLDDVEHATQIELSAGDVIVLPAGVAHCNTEPNGDYQYVGLYPKGSPRFDNNFCKAGPEETARKADSAERVPVPETDPIYGPDGPLTAIWSTAIWKG